jgi:uncharacterized repeat protein (TIGR03803 family)
MTRSFFAALLGSIATLLGGTGMAPAQTLTTLYTFGGGTDGAFPEAGLIADASGALYGTTGIGGTPCASHVSCGTVFKLTPPGATGGPWTETVLNSFTGVDGWAPGAGLIADASGALYGTTRLGGFGSGGPGGGFGTCCGTVFKLTPPGVTGGPWTETVLHAFGGDGTTPEAGLIADASGALYGTTAQDGVFKLTPPGATGGPWTETVLYSFIGGGDGAAPVAGLIADASGALYGTTQAGGGTGCAGGLGCGTVFKLTPPTTTGGTWTESVLYSFTGGTDGANPVAGLIADTSGALYGTTEGGGSGGGTVFKLTLPATFAGVPGQANCHGQSISFLANTYGGIAAAATALGYASVKDLQDAVTNYCAG